MKVSVLIGLLVIASDSLHAQVSGRVYADVNANGKLDSFESGQAGILIKAYILSHELGQPQLLTQTRSDERGYYELSIPAGLSIRVVFDSPASGLQSSGSTPATTNCSKRSSKGRHLEQMMKSSLQLPSVTY